jgi:CubicO group peptidase (beta-lactamase class C family)
MSDAVPDDFDALVRSVMEEWQVPGLSIAAVHDREPDWLAAYGLRDVEAGLPVTSDTRFLLCSITKSFTALGLAMLVDDGRLDWTKPVRELLPEFRLHDAVATERVTVQDLLSHHWGLPRHDWVWMPADISRQEMFAALRHLEPSKDIRSTFQYSNLGYVVAGMVAERISGQSWEDFTSERITDPLGMGQTVCSADALHEMEGAARPYVLTDSQTPGDFKRRRAKIWPIADAPAGAIVSTAPDMLRYMRFNLSGGEINGVRLVSQEGLRAMQSPRVHTGKSEYAESGDIHYGLGLATYPYYGERIVSHSGGWIGWSTLMAMTPERRCGVTVLTNRGGNPVAEILVYALLDHWANRARTPWFERLREKRRTFIADRTRDASLKQTARRTDAPSRPLKEYAGTYDHPAYRRVEIAAADERLEWRYRGMIGPMRHRHFDVFDLDEQPETLWPDAMAVTFLYDREGYIDRLTAPLESTVADIVFRRVPQGEALDPEFRRACVGKYRGGVEATVALDAQGGLTLSLPGQTPYRLTPYRDRVFSISTLDGYRVEFQIGDAGPATTIIFHQPNGTYSGQRVADEGEPTGL